MGRSVPSPATVAGCQAERVVAGQRDDFGTRSARARRGMVEALVTDARVSDDRVLVPGLMELHTRQDKVQPLGVGGVQDPPLAAPATTQWYGWSGVDPSAVGAWRRSGSLGRQAGARGRMVGCVAGNPACTISAGRSQRGRPHTHAT